MAMTIAERIKKQQADEADKRLAAQQAAGGGKPSTPGGMSGLGSTPDQAKMAGTPASKINMGTSADVGTPPVAAVPTTSQFASAQADAEAAAPQDNTLQTAEGEENFDDAQRDAAQERAKAFSEKMETFGSLGGRVESMVTGAFSGKTAEGDLKNLASDIGFEIGDVQGLVGPGVDPTEMVGILQDFSKMAQTNPDSAFDILVNNQNKFKNPSSGIMSIVDKAYKKNPADMHSTVAKLVSDNIVDPDQVNFEHLISSGFVNVDESGMIAELGITTSEIQEILGDEWKNLTPEQIGEQVEAKRGEVLSTKDDIEKQLSDPNLPPQNRAALLDELKRMGAIGAVEYEQRAKESQIEAADSGKIMVGGEVQDVAELLKDEEIKGDVVNFLADPDSEENKQWAESNPEFADWLSRELSTLSTTKTNLEKSLDDFTNIQKDNETFAVENLSESGGRLNSSLMSAMGFDATGFNKEGYQPGDNPVYDMLEKLPDGADTQQAVAALNELPEQHIADLKKLDPAKLRVILTDPAKIDEFRYKMKLKDNWASARDRGPEAMLGTIFQGSEIKDQAGLTKMMSDLHFRARIGGDSKADAKYNLLMKMFDKDGDGSIDDMNGIRAAMDEVIGTEGKLDFMVNNREAGHLNELRGIKYEPFQGSYADAPIYDNINKYLGQGSSPNKIDANELNELQNSMEPAEFLAFAGKLQDPRFKSFIAGNEDQLLNVIDNAQVQSVEKIPGIPKDVSSYINELDVESAVHNSNLVGQVNTAREALLRMTKEGGARGKQHATTKLKELLAKTVQPARTLIEGEGAHSQLAHVASNQMNGIRLSGPLPGFDPIVFQKINGGWTINPGHLVSKHPDLVARWGTWQNFAKDKGNGDEFFRALKGAAT